MHTYVLSILFLLAASTLFVSSLLRIFGVPHPAGFVRNITVCLAIVTVLSVLVGCDAAPAEQPPPPEIVAIEDFLLYPYYESDKLGIPVTKDQPVYLIAVSEDHEWLLVEVDRYRMGWGKRERFVPLNPEYSLERFLTDDYWFYYNRFFEPPPINVNASSISYRLAANGDAKNILSVEMDSLTIGASELTYPTFMNLDEDAFVELVIHPATILAALSSSDPAHLPSLSESAALPNTLLGSVIGITSTLDYRTEYGREIQIFPIMRAELKASGDSFLIVAETELNRNIRPNESVRWRWIITARAAGVRNLLLNIFIPITVDGRFEVIESRELASFPIHVEVLITPTPTATDTPIPTVTPTATPTPTFFEQSRHSIANNFDTIVAALLSLVGVAIVAIYGPIIVERWKRHSEDDKSSSLNIAKMYQRDAITAITASTDFAQLKVWLVNEQNAIRKRPKIIEALENRIKQLESAPSR
jgi:hypothetical protein